jgi:hypothetical protein
VTHDQGPGQGEAAVSDAAPRTPPSWFDLATGGELPQDRAARWTLETFAGTLLHAPCWLLETSACGPVRLDLRARLQADSLTIQTLTDGRELEIILTPGASGWVEITVRLDERAALRAWMDRPYEEYELWPGGADITPNRSAEAPGRIGKRLNWINLSSGAWPQLAALANPSGFMVASASDA